MFRIDIFRQQSFWLMTVGVYTQLEKMFFAEFRRVNKR
jgi:hypothetical protein